MSGRPVGAKNGASFNWRTECSDEEASLIANYEQALKSLRFEEKHISVARNRIINRCISRVRRKLGLHKQYR